MATQELSLIRVSHGLGGGLELIGFNVYLGLQEGATYDFVGFGGYLPFSVS